MCGSSSVNLVNSSMSGSVCSKKKSSSSGSTHQHSDRGNGCTDTVQIGIGTLNVRSLWYQDKGPGALKLYHIICEMQHHCIDVMGVSETQWFGEGWFTVPYRGFDSYRVFHFGKRDKEKDKVNLKKGEPRKGGVAIILSPKARQLYVDGSYQTHLKDICRGRLMSILLDDTRIFVMYAPQKYKERETFVKNLESDLKKTEKSDKTKALILMGDFNEDSDAKGDTSDENSKTGKDVSEKYPLIIDRLTDTKGDFCYEGVAETDGYVDHILYKKKRPSESSHTANGSYFRVKSCEHLPTQITLPWLKWDSKWNFKRKGRIRKDQRAVLLI